MYSRVLTANCLPIIQIDNKLQRVEDYQMHGIMGRRFPDGGLLKYRK